MPVPRQKSGRRGRTPGNLKASAHPERSSAESLDYAKVFELAADPILIVDLEGRYIDANRAACELTGYTREELVSRRLGDLTVAEERGDVERHFAELQLLGRGRRVATLVRKDGTRLSVECHNVRLDEGTFVGIVRDISDRLSMQRVLQQTNDALTTLLTICPDAVITADDRMRITLWNPAAEAMFGYSRDEALGRSVRDLIPERHRPAALRGWQKHLDRKEGGRFGRTLITEGLRKDGVEVPVELSVAVGMRGQDMVYTAVARDVRSHREAVERLNEALQQLRLHIDRMPLGYVLWDRDFRVTEWNPSAERIFGYSREEALGRAAWDIVPDEARPAVEKVWVELLAGNMSSHSINDNVRKDGARITCEWFNTPLRDSAGHIVAVASMVSDITERQLQETQVRNMQKLESLGVMAGGIAHDFNSSLMVILGNAGLLRSIKGLPPRALEHIALIEEAGLRANDLIKHLLAYARTGRHNPQLTELNTVIREANTFLRSSIGKLHELRLELADQLPSIIVDRSQIEQVLLNLCMNAKEAMARGGMILLRTGDVTLTAENLARCVPHDGRPGRYVELAVVDTGCGMSESVQARMFDPFFTTKPEGHGLGMAAVLGILRQHNAVSRVESREKAGTQVLVYFPVAAAAKTA
jgi:two-component system cell cycle sensor histidine kinase/response regulator CckA